MQIFKEHAKKLWDNGFVSIPCSGKKPVAKKWQEWTEDIDSQREKLNSYIQEYPNLNVGFLLGPINKLIALDLDIEDPELLSALLKHIPASSISKKGAKGITIFYEYANQNAQKSQRMENKLGKTVGIELLATGNQTVLPPSLHPDGMKYEWIQGSLYDLKSPDIDLPIFKSSDFDNLCIRFYEIAKNFGYEFIVSKAKTGEDISGGRNHALVKYVMELNDRNKSLQYIVKNVIKRDKELFDKPLFEDSSEITGDSVEERAANFVASVSSTHIKKKVKKEKDKISDSDDDSEESNSRGTTYKKFYEFFSKNLDDAILEKLTGELLYKERGKWQPVFSKLPVIRSEAHSAGLNRGYVEDHLTRFIKTRTPRLLFDIPKWDGVSRLEKIFSCIVFDKEGIGPTASWDLFRNWCANIFKRIEDPMNQNEILVLRGGQGIGKDTFVNKVFGKTFANYFVNIEPSERNQENFMSVHGKLIANISEFDQTNKLTLGSIKNLITANSQRFRMPYERAAKDYDFHVSFIASSNFESILRDPTGNRRYVILDPMMIEFEYDKFLDHDQIRAEIHYLYASGFKPAQSSVDALKRLIDDETPEAYESQIKERMKNYIDNLIKNRFDRRVIYSDIDDEVQKIAKTYQITVFRVLHILKLAKFQKKTGSMRYYTTDSVSDV